MKSLTLQSTLLIGALSLISVAVYAGGGDDHSHDNEKPLKKSNNSMAAEGVSHLIAPQRLSDGSLFIPKPIQRQLGIRTQVANTTDLAATIELNGKVIADPDTGGRVQATFAGTILAGAKGMPSLGRKVVKGEVLAFLRPIDSAIERGNQMAQLADLEAQLDIVSRKLARYEQLASVVPVKELEATRIEKDSLIRRKNFVNTSINANEPLRASASGTISASYVVAGQVVDAKEVLFEIVDTSRLAVEALAYDTQIGGQLTSATALLPLAQQSVSIELNYIGSGQQLRDQALPVLFKIKNNAKLDGNTLAVGQPIKVIVRTKNNIQGAAVLRSALGKTNAGETIVWVHKEAERFVALRIRHQSLDSNTIAITQGLHEGDRVVVIGAGLLAEVR